MRSIRNFVIIAHIDHGKSTLADRFLELTGTVEKRKMREQYLDMHPLERERGITIKMQPVRMIWKPNHAQTSHQLLVTGDQSNSAQEIVLNLIDTPGHADFSYEVSRALAAVEGAILLVDATQGVQAQTLANLNLAQKEGLAIIPAVNKIDLPSAQVEETCGELGDLLGCPAGEVYRISAKEGTGVEALLRAVAEKIPPPRGEFKRLNSLNRAEPLLRALIFDSKYDPYLGVVAHIRIVDGSLAQGERIAFLATGAEAEALETGVFLPERTPTEALGAGEIGYVATGIKEPAQVKAGDTLTCTEFKRLNRLNVLNAPPLAGYRESEPVVFASLYPENQDDYEALREALGKLKLEDAALSFIPEDAGGLGRGFRAGFLGLLHMEIVAERLKREYGLAAVLTTPSVALLYRSKIGTEGVAYSAAHLPDAQDIAELQEPRVKLEVVTPSRYLGVLTALVSGAEGIITKTETLAGERLYVEAETPLREVITDFYDKLKSASEGFASFSYSVIGYCPADLLRLDILIAGENQPALAEIVPKTKAYEIGRRRLAGLKELLPRSLFAIALQASIGGRIIARETVSALKKDVTGYLYGGDRTRKMKLWKKQQRGKKRLKEAGRVVIPPEVFLRLRRKTSNQ